MAARATKLSGVAVVAAALLLTAGLTRPALQATDLRSADLVRSAATTPAHRIVSLVPALTEMLFAVGAGPQVVGVSSYDDFPPEVQSRQRVGALLDPDTERILSLKPDLVIVYASQIELEAQFARVGIHVYQYRHAGIANVLQTIRELGDITGHKNEGDRVALQLQSQLDAVRARVRGQPRPKTMLVIGRDALTLRGLFASGGVGFLHELLDVAGGDDVFADVKREAVQPSNETMLVRAPQVIIELHPGEQPSADMLQREHAVWSILPSVPAVRNGRVYLLYSSAFMSPGPRIARTAEAFARVLHPEVFK